MRYTMMQVFKETGMTYQALKFLLQRGARPQRQARQEQPPRV